MLIGAFSTLEQVYMPQINLWPHPIKLNFSEINQYMKDPDFLIAYKNSFLIALSIIPRVTVSMLAGFALARLRGKGSMIVFYFILATVMLPFSIIIIPQYIMFNQFGWIDTYLPFWLPAFMGDAFFIFIIRQFIMGIPKELDEAAYIDGCSTWRLFFQIIVPLCKPVISVCLIFSFVSYWNSFLGPLIFLSRSSHKSLPLAINALVYQLYQVTPWNTVMLICLLAAIPLFLIFFLLQKYIISGFVMSGVKQ